MHSIWIKFKMKIISKMLFKVYLLSTEILIRDRFRVVGFHLGTHGNTITYKATLAHIDSSGLHDRCNARR